MTVFRLSREKLRSQGSETRRRWRRGARRRSAGQSRRQGALLFCTNEFVQVALEAFTRPRGARVVSEVRVVDAVHLRDAERPGAAPGGRGRLDVDGSDDPGGEELVLQHVARAQLLERRQRALRSVGNGRDFLAPADPEVAGFIGPARVEQGDVRRDGRHVKNRVCALGKRVLQHFPVRSSRQQVRTDRKSTRLNSSHGYISYAVFCLKKKKKK